MILFLINLINIKSKIINHIENGIEYSSNDKNSNAFLTVSNHNNSFKQQMRYQYSFTDSIILDDFTCVNDFKVQIRIMKLI